MRLLCIDLFCGLGGWAEGFLHEGYDVIGFDIERWPYPGQLALQDVTTLDGSQFRDAAVIVASPPCQAYSYRAMPWKRAQVLPPPDNSLFHACFRIQREACEAAGRHIPMVVENVNGAQRWVGRAVWHYGSYYLWGDVPALMPMGTCRKTPITYPKHGTWFGVSGGRKFDRLDRADWFDCGPATCSSRSRARKVASALMAKIPFPLAQHIARVYAAGPSSP